ncbi:hypothetical protein SAMN05192539_102317 [Paraburkholderia diazotrophica]|uniref:Broad specificity phosphatase PhoE n=1 Tax=Paraburkholderia diazotrophica TaxID=667676 RepID=A0A1H7CNC2_9BURK|nr:hypothetical protein SAMN05192539_102317 [Paraburkholderia diazotrophica]
MSEQTVLIIRHAEKPEAGGDTGIDGSGAPDSRSLTPRGWQRAGIWTELFAPSLDHAGTYPRPAAIFASAPATHSEIAAGNSGSKSRRPLETVSPLAAKLGIDVNLNFGKGQEGDLAAAIAQIDGITLVCWQHEDIASIATALAPTVENIPSHWPGDRFNVIFEFSRTGNGEPWSFNQVVPVMLQGDPTSSI